MKKNCFLEVIKKFNSQCFEKLVDMSLGEIGAEVEASFRNILVGNGFFGRLDDCLIADLFRYNDFQSLPVQKHLTAVDNDYDVFVLANVGFGKCPNCDKIHKMYGVLLLDYETGYYDFGLRVLDNMPLSTKSNSQIKSIRDIVPLLTDYTDMFDNPSIIWG